MYSYQDIKVGAFVTTSRHMALGLCKGKPERLKGKVVLLEDVAWVNGDEGVYTRIKK